jgi:beta-phosphoglucomutase-like phosphatase (HAD superfamily)
MIVEDAISGVQAGAKGRFGLTLGVARENNADELRRNGADLIVTDLSEISLDEIDNWFKSKGENAGSTCSEVLRTRNV